MLAMMAVINPGDEVIFLDPYFVMYKHLLTMTGGVPVPVDSYPDFRFHADRVEKAITPRTKMLMLNSPQQSYGRGDDPSRSTGPPVDLARKHDLLILSDEIYEPFLYLDGHRGHGKLPSPRPVVRSHDYPPRFLQEPCHDRLGA